MIRFFFYKKHQALCGYTILEEKMLIAHLSKDNIPDFNLSKSKRAKTKNLRLIISIPIYKWSDNNYNVVGTINIDTMRENVASALLQEKNKIALAKYFDYFWDFSEYISYWL